MTPFITVCYRIRLTNRLGFWYHDEMESVSNFPTPDVPLGMQKCLRLRCPVVFPKKGSGLYQKKYCSRRCSKSTSERLRHARHPEIERASRRRRNLRYRASHPEWAAKQDTKAAQKRTAVRRAISNEMFELLIQAQGNRCPIGDHEFSSIRGSRNSTTAPVRDHCHRTGKWRAILCSEHNRALGMFHDSFEELQAAIDYIQKWTQKHQEIA